MFTINTILHPTDFSAGANGAWAHAVQMARHHQARLHLLNVAPGLGEDPVRSAYAIGAGDTDVYEKVKAKAHEMMDALVEDAGAGDLDVVRAHERGVAAGPVIMDYADAHDVELIVMGTHGRRGMKRFVLGSVAEEVVQEASCSVMTVRSERDEVPTPQPIERVLVPVDLSAYTVPLFRAALNMAATYGARIDMLHVVEPLPFPVPLIGGLTLHDLVSDPAEQARKQLEQLAGSITHPSVTVESHVEEGHAAKTIVEQTDALDSDLVMIASHGLSGVERFMLGSVTARVVRQAACPVLVTRVAPEEQEEPSPEAG